MPRIATSKHITPPEIEKLKSYLVRMEKIRLTAIRPTPRTKYHHQL